MNRDQTITFLEEMIEIEKRYDQLKNISLNIEMRKNNIVQKCKDNNNHYNRPNIKLPSSPRNYKIKYHSESNKILDFFSSFIVLSLPFITSFVISFIILILLKIILNPLKFLFGELPWSEIFFWRAIIASIISLIITIINKSDIDDSIDQEELEKRKINDYERHVKEYKARLKHENTQLKKEYEQLCIEAEPIEKQKKATLDLMYSFYSSAGIYDKYWNIEATAAFLEYFESGICSSFTGYDGAYARFENDMKYKSLMGKLDNISNRLDLIADNQITLYNAISESNQIINTVSNKILSNVRSSAQTTNNYLASIDYTNKINQANIRSLTEMKALELMLK